MTEMKINDNAAEKAAAYIYQQNFNHFFGSPKYNGEELTFREIQCYCHPERKSSFFMKAKFMEAQNNQSIGIKTKIYEFDLLSGDFIRELALQDSLVRDMEEA